MDPETMCSTHGWQHDPETCAECCAIQDLITDRRMAAEEVGLGCWLHRDNRLLGCGDCVRLATARGEERQAIFESQRGRDHIFQEGDTVYIIDDDFVGKHWVITSLYRLGGETRAMLRWNGGGISQDTNRTLDEISSEPPGPAPMVSKADIKFNKLLVALRQSGVCAGIPEFEELWKEIRPDDPQDLRVDDEPEDSESIR